MEKCEMEKQEGKLSIPPHKPGDEEEMTEELTMEEYRTACERVSVKKVHKRKTQFACRRYGPDGLRDYDRDLNHPA
jgi:hypothetical protein